MEAHLYTALTATTKRLTTPYKMVQLLLNYGEDMLNRHGVGRLNHFNTDALEHAKLLKKGEMANASRVFLKKSQVLL